MPTRTYDSCEVIVSVGGQPLTGFAQSSKVTVERDEDAFTKYIGVDGEVSRSKNCNKAGTVTITLAQTSPSNDLLSELALNDEAANSGVVPILIRDLNGTTLATAPDAWVRKLPSAEFGKEIGEREWVFDCGRLNLFVGGAAASRSAQEAA